MKSRPIRKGIPSEVIDEALTDLGMTSYGFSKILHCTNSLVEKMRSTGIQVSSKYFSQVCDELGISPEEYDYV